MPWVNHFLHRFAARQLCLVVLGFCVLSGAVPARAALEIMVEDDATPWSQADGSGAANDIVKAAFAAAGVDVVLHTVPYPRCKHMVLTGQIAACFSMSADASIADKVLFPKQPLYKVYTQYFHNPQRPLRAVSERDIPSTAVIGIVAGYEYPASVTGLAQRGVTLEAAGSETANLKKLATGRIDATILNLDALKSGDFLLRNAHVDTSVAALFRTPEFGSYIGFSAQHPQGKWAREKFDEGFAKIDSDGTLQKIIRNWQMQRR